MPMEADIQRVYEDALATLVARLQADSYVLAAILLGSLSHDVVWEKSDIDLLIVTQEVKSRGESFCLVENGINVHACVMTRSQFKRTIEGAVHSSFIHSMLMKGRMLFSRDETLAELFANRDELGSRDREIQLMEAAMGILPILAKAGKWLHVKRDRDYCFVWLIGCVTGLAKIEALLAGEATGREVIHQALRLNPAFFEEVYTGMIHGPKTDAHLLGCLSAVEAYLRERTPQLFRPLLDYLDTAGGMRSSTEINHYFRGQMNLEGMDLACEWLADEDVIRKAPIPARLTEKSRADVNEAGYYFEHGM